MDLESFNPISKLRDEDKYGINVPEQYQDIVNELNNVNYSIENENYDNLMDLDNFSISKPTDDAHEMLEGILREDDENADYKIASLGIELGKRNKEALNYRSRFNSENFRKSFGLDEELDEADYRQWYDRDQLDLDF